MATFAFNRDFRTLLFSPRRTVSVAQFKIATIALPWKLFLSCDDYANVADLRNVCCRFESELEKVGWRLPTEDKFEIAAGGELFAWGNVIPDGIPYDNRTKFTKHKERTPRGLRLNDNPYNVELVSTALKMGDGGVSICGGEAWPMAWLSLSPAYRAPEDMFESVLPEYLETTLIRPVIAM